MVFVKLWIYEWKKVFRQKSFLLLLIFGAVLNAGFLNFSESFSSHTSYTPESYCRIWEDISPMADEAAYRMLTKTYDSLKETYSSTYGMEREELCVYTDDLWTEMQLIEDVKNEVYNSLIYVDYLDSIQEDAHQMLEVSIFREESAFSTRNIEKTAADFEEMEGLIPEASKSKGITMATGFLLTDLIGVLLIFVFCLYLALYEKQTGQSALISPTSGGRRQTILAKTGVLFLGSCIIYFILYGGNFLSAWMTYGFDHLSGMVQSVPAYQSCTLMISVGDYFVLFTMVKILFYFMIGLFILFLNLRMKKWLGIVAVVLMVFGGSFAASFLIPENSIFMSAKYLNLVSFLRTDILLMDYQNVNLFGYPVSLFPVAVTVMAIWTVLFIMWILAPAERQEILWNSNLYQGKKRKTVRTGKSLCYFELLKAEKKSGLTFLFILLIAFQLIRINQYSFFNEPDEVYYRTYMNYLSELTDSDMDAYVEVENARYASLLSQEVTDENMHELKQELLPYKGWTDTLDEYDRIRMGEGLTLVYPAGYLQLMGKDPNTDMISVMILMIFLSICLSGIFSVDYEGGMNFLLSTTVFGRSATLKAKKIISMGIAILAFFCVCISDFLMFYIKIGMNKSNASLQSISMFAAYEGNFKIWQYLVVLYIIKFIGMITAVHGIWMISEFLRDTIRSVLLSIILFVLPTLLGLLGMDTVLELTLLPLLIGNTLLNQCLMEGNLISIFLYLIGAIAVMIAVNLYLNRRYLDRKSILVGQKNISKYDK